MKKEAPLLKKIQILFSKQGNRLFRNHTGMAWHGWVTEEYFTSHPKKGRIKVIELADARRIHYGLTQTGSSDLVGWSVVEITQRMVGKKIAVFTAVEGKTPRDRLSKDQKNFLRQVRLFGGIALVGRENKKTNELVFEEFRG